MKKCVAAAAARAMRHNDRQIELLHRTIEAEVGKQNYTTAEREQVEAAAVAAIAACLDRIASLEEDE